MDFSTFISELGSRLGIDAPSSGAAADANAIYAITLPSGISISLEGLDGGRQCALSGLICRYPPEADRLPLFDRLMEAHAYGVATDGAYFAASPRAGKVVLAKTLDLTDASFDSLVAAIDSFATQYQMWRQEYEAGRLTAPNPPTSAPSQTAVTYA